jgi:hypothetical protein
MVKCTHLEISEFFVWLFLLREILYSMSVETGKNVLSITARESWQQITNRQVREVSETFGHRFLLCGER